MNNTVPECGVPVWRPKWKAIAIALIASLIFWGVIIGVCLAGCGCTPVATREAIRHYEASDDATAMVFHNAIRVADEQMFLNFTQFYKENWFRQELVLAAFTATWEARRGLEEMRLQFERSRTLSRLTVGQYIYDQQGAINVLLEDQARQLKTYTDAGQRANEKAGVNSVTEAIPPELKEKLKGVLTPSEFEKALREAGVVPEKSK